MEKKPNWFARQRNKQREKDKGKIHPWRWRAITVWIILITLVAGYAIRQGRDGNEKTRDLTAQNAAAIREVKAQSARLRGLQKTNCGLVLFLMTARRARYDNYKLHHQKADLEAVRGYESLVKLYLYRSAVGKCVIKKRLQIKKRPLRIQDNA